MSTRLEIINNALMKVGLPLAAAEREEDWNATVVFETIAKQALRSFPWSFATKFAVLTKNTNAPAHGFNFSYSLPTDCLRVVDVRQHNDLRAPKGRFVVSGKLLYANVDPCNIRYVMSELNPTNWPDDFCDAVSCKIAAEIANLSAQTATMTPGLLQMYQLSLAQAQSIDSTETNERVPLDESILMARAGQ